jgi:hypothetical protein
MSDPFTITTATPPGQRPLSRREVLWNELESLHVQLQLPPPMQTYTLEELDAVVTQLRVQQEEHAS